jgi:hypothetical protein
MSTPKEIRKQTRAMNAMAKQMELMELAKVPGALQAKLIKDMKAKANRKIKAMIRKSVGI